MSNQKSYFLFDCDGTLFDTEPLKAKSWGKGYACAIKFEFDEACPEIEQKVSVAYKAGGTTNEVGDYIVRQCKDYLAMRCSEIVTSITPEQLIEERKLAKDKIFDAVFPVSGITQEAKNLVIRPVWNFAFFNR